MRLEEAKKDQYRRLAKREGYKSRAAYKLLQIQRKYKIIKKGDKVLDLGCSPGGWSQVALNFVGKKGKVIGVDLKDTHLFSENFIFLKRDIYKEGLEEEILSLLKDKVDLLLSDLSPNLSGIWELDYEKQLDLTKRAIDILNKVLKRKGNAVLKIFQSPYIKSLEEDLKRKFEKVLLVKPPASRKESSELYLLCLKLK
ncbi:Ribosomal RNA large subunit methyltransferase E [archaeon HR06]|nr:Ribosomal RNA large subunit methyltransferase E [archaeon HR06]